MVCAEMPVRMDWAVDTCEAGGGMLGAGWGRTWGQDGDSLNACVVQLKFGD